MVCQPFIVNSINIAQTSSHLPKKYKPAQRQLNTPTRIPNSAAYGYRTSERPLRSCIAAVGLRRFLASCPQIRTFVGSWLHLHPDWHVIRIRQGKMRLRDLAILGACGLGLASLCGCASSWHPPRSRSIAIPAESHGADLVFSAPETLDEDLTTDPYYDRRDASLGVPSTASELQALAYPGAPAPDLYDLHWITLRRTPDQFLYFDRYPRYDSEFGRIPRHEPRPQPVRRQNRGWENRLR